MRSAASLATEQRAMMARKLQRDAHRQRERLSPFRQIKDKPAKRVVVKPKSKKWITSHFAEIMERIIDDLGLDVPRREPKLTA